MKPYMYMTWCTVGIFVVVFNSIDINIHIMVDVCTIFFGISIIIILD